MDIDQSTEVFVYFGHMSSLSYIGALSEDTSHINKTLS